MRGLDWAALPFVVEMLGVQEVESLVMQLIEIRNHSEQARG